VVATDKTVDSAPTTVAKSRVYYYSATWCGPCRVFGPMVDEVSKDYPDIEIKKLDIDKEEAQILGFKHGVMSVPTLFNENTRPIVGAVSETTLRNWLDTIRSSTHG